MDEQALQGLAAHNNPQAQQQALQYFEQLKESEKGWQLCANVLTSGMYMENDHVRFFCFQVIEHFIKTRYNSSTMAERELLKSFLMGWIQFQNANDKDKNFVKNKAAQVFSLVFITDYPHRWLTFLTDLLQTMSLGQVAVDFYLRVLDTIDSEVVDRDIVHTSIELERNTLIKDTMRDQCVPQLVDSWYQIIMNYQDTHADMVCLCLNVIGSYVSWIDINLVANDRFVAVLLQFLQKPLLRESACDCIYEVISKGMDPNAKTKLIESFSTVLGQAGVMDAEDADGDFSAKLSKLVNGMGMNLIACWNKISKTGDVENAALIMQALENKVPLMLKFLDNEDDDVSGAVSLFAHDYITMLKSINPISEKQRQNIERTLYVIIRKMKYDECYNFDVEGEEEAMFMEYRKQLKVVFNNLAQLDAQLVMVTVHNIVSQTLPNWKTADFRDVETAITVMYMIGEAIPLDVLSTCVLQIPQGQSLTASDTKLAVMNQLMRVLVTSGVSSHPHTKVLIQFYETVVRYDKFFTQEPEHIAPVLMAFLDERGLRNSSVQVASRVTYLFSRFVKSLRTNLNAYTEEILTRMQDLLVLNTPDNGCYHRLSSSDQQFLYEAAGILIVSAQFPPEKKSQMMKNLLAPIVTKFDVLLQKMILSNDETMQKLYAECISAAMALASRTSKGFSSQQTIKTCGCAEAYTETLKVFLVAFNTPIHRPLLHSGVRQFLHRMVVCLESEILPYIPTALENLLKNPEPKELHDFIPLINQLIMKFKKTIIPFLQQVFMALVTTIFQVLNSPTDELDQIATSEKKMLQRSYFLFLCVLVSNNVTEVLSNQDPQNLQQVLMTVIQGAVELPDPVGQKMCFSILKKLVEVWGSNECLAGFGEFIYKNIIPACFLAPMKPTFDLSDGQTVLVLNESAACLKEIHNKRADEMVNFLQNDYFCEMNVTPDLIEEYCQALKTDSKTFKNYVKAFFTKAKS
ncbi:exportin-T-like [Tubulanus polymorphus]|uniref:exportin-T-like n=1 Tax=Tubulanus polymorphus TaxID=672921 RepID=UPI003DA3FDE9